MNTLLGLLLGIGLSAAAGFKVFVPLLVTSIASLTGQLEVAESFSWISTYPALITLSIATLLEIAAYFIPAVDNLLDTVATPAAVIAGAVITSSFVGEVSPFLKWALRIIGGSTAATVQLSTVAVRGASTAGTGGAANPVLNLIETASSAFTAIVTILLPYLAIIIVLALLYFIISKLLPQLKKFIARLMQNNKSYPK